MAFGSILLRCIARAGVKGAVNLLTFGVGGDLLQDIWDAWKCEQGESQRRAELERLAAASPAEVRPAARQAIDECGASLSAEQRQQLVDWLSQTPAALRRSLRRPEDPSGRTVPAGLQLRGPDDLAALLPGHPPRFRPGEIPLPGVPWQLQELLGMGGFGEVWKAHNPRVPGLSAALKFCLDPAARDRLLGHEARVVAQVLRQGKHPGIVELRQAYLDHDPPCLEYEYVEGGDLGALIQQWHRNGQATPERINRLMLELASILAFAHRQGIVHRDLKPANVLTQGAGTAVTLRVTDFGIGGVAAGQTRDAQGPTSLATVAPGAYTALYASPEQMRGGKADPRDDVYSLGVVWYQLLAGDLNARAPTGDAWKEELLRQGMASEALALLVRCLEQKAENRPRSAVEIEECLRQALAEPAAPGVTRRQPVPARPEPPQAVPVELAPGLVDAQHAAEAREREAMALRVRLVKDLANVGLRKHYLAARTDALKGVDQAVEIQTSRRVLGVAGGLLGGLLGGLPGVFSSELWACVSPFLFGGGVLIGGSLGWNFGERVDSENESALRAICAELGPLPPGAPTDLAAARRQFLGE